MRTRWLAVIASAGVMIWSVAAAASPSLAPPTDGRAIPVPLERDPSPLDPGAIRADTGDDLQMTPFAMSVTVLGETIKPAVAWTGSYSSIETRQIVRINDTKAWRDLWIRHRGDTIEQNALGFPVVPEIDFDRYMVIAIFAGEGPGSAGYELAEAREIVQPGVTVRDGPPPAGARVLRVRLASRVYQTAGDLDPPKTTAYGFFVLPRTELLTLIELARYHGIGEPPTWHRATMLSPGLRFKPRK